MRPAPLQEKAVQDRLIRETQDALLDKVSLAELNMFEAWHGFYVEACRESSLVCRLWR